MQVFKPGSIKCFLSLLKGYDCLEQGSLFRDGCIFFKRHHHVFYIDRFHFNPPKFLYSQIFHSPVDQTNQCGIRKVVNNVKAPIILMYVE